jgi:ferredoxin
LKPRGFWPSTASTSSLDRSRQWGLDLADGKQIRVDTEKFETSTPKACSRSATSTTYPGKLKLILSGFHEAALASQAAFRIARPDEKLRFQYTTSSSELQQRLKVGNAIAGGLTHGEFSLSPTAPAQDHRLEAVDGWRLMELLRDHGVGIEGICGGACACASCHVVVRQDLGRPPAPPREDELDRLDELPVIEPTSRLSCQIIWSEASTA